LANGVERLLFVVDAAGLTGNLRLIRELDADHVLISELQADTLAAHRRVAVDVDLTNTQNIIRLRSAMRGRRHGVFQAFAIDLQRRLETVHARIIGATDLTRRPFQALELLRRISDFEERRRREPAIVVTESIDAAAESLGDVFGALTSGAEIELPGVMAAGAEVADAIAEVDFTNWVDEVRRHHEGTFQHCLLVTGLAGAFGRSTGMNRRDIATLTTAGLLHDIGKAAVPIAILDKPGKLTPQEMEIIRSHPVEGWQHLHATIGLDAEVLSVVRSHHEYLDGSGYPDGISGSDIGDLTRILTICDVYGAMIERRAYKPPEPPAAAIAVLEEMARLGKLEPPLVRAFHQAVAA
jgi:putative nucleotidyltransferase with HDIG domain